MARRRSEATETRPGGALLPRFLRARRGTASVEFVVLAPVFFLMIFAILEMAMISFSASTLKAGISEAGRLVKVGKAQCFDDAAAKNAICGSAFLPSCTARLSVEREVFPLGFGSAAVKSSFAGTNPGDIVLLRATYQWQVMTPIAGTALGDAQGKLPLTRSLLFKTEDFVSASCP